MTEYVLNNDIDVPLKVVERIQRPRGSADYLCRVYFNNRIGKYINPILEKNINIKYIDILMAGSKVRPLSELELLVYSIK